MVELSKDESAWLRDVEGCHHTVTSRDTTAGERADGIRRMMALLQVAAIKKWTSPPAASFLYNQQMALYEEVTGRPENQGGLNNYASQSLALMQGRKYDSKQWKSSLAEKPLDSIPAVQQYIQLAKAAKESVIPAGFEGKELPGLTANKTASNVPTCANKADSVSHTKHKVPLFRSDRTNHTGNMASTRPAGTSNLGNSHDELLGRSHDRAHADFYNLGTAGTSKPPGPPIPAFQGNGVGVEGTFTAEGQGSSRGRWNFKPNQVGAAFSSVGQNQSSPAISSVEQNPSNTAFSRTGNEIYPAAVQPNPGRRNFNGNSGLLRNEATKRPFGQVDNEEEEDSPAAPAFSAFRTAKTQLAIDQQKKYGRGRGGAQLSTTSYGSNKRSLGTRRGPSSKFVPPLMNRDQGDDSGSLVRKVGSSLYGSSGDGNHGDGDEAVDERLKNIEPKMVELIKSEIMDHGPPISWDDIAGLEFAKTTIKEIVVWPMLRPDIFTGLRGPPKGLLLFGPPGTGKTLIGKCIACRSKSTFFSISASSLTSKWVGEGEKMVRALFAVARVEQPAVIFIDEIDSLLSQRTDGEHEASRRIKTEFLVQLDGATTGSEERILVVGATNRPQEIDEAARRRFVKRLYIPLPEAEARQKIIVNLLREQRYQLSQDQLVDICQKSQGFSGADVACLCREAALGPIRCISLEDIENITPDQVRPIVYQDFLDALDHVRASVSTKDLDVYLEWNQLYGSGSHGTS